MQSIVHDVSTLLSILQELFIQNRTTSVPIFMRWTTQINWKSDVQSKCKSHLQRLNRFHEDSRNLAQERTKKTFVKSDSSALLRMWTASHKLVEWDMNECQPTLFICLLLSCFHTQPNSSTIRKIPSSNECCGNEPSNFVLVDVVGCSQSVPDSLKPIRNLVLCPTFVFFYFDLVSDSYVYFLAAGI